MTRSEDIISRIARELGGDEVLAALRRLSPRDLHSLLLYLHNQEAAAKSLPELLDRHERAPLFALAFVDPRVNLIFAEAAFTAAAAFEAIELSPVCPLGTISTISGIHQNNVLSASRGSELVADPTPVLALECARRRRSLQAREVPLRLCTSQRMVRMQPAPAGLLPHFRLFALVTALRQAPHAESDELRQHLEVYLRTFALLEERGFAFRDVTISVSHTGAIESWLRASGQHPEEIRKQVRTQVWNDPDALLKERGLSPIRGRAAAIRGHLSGLPPSLLLALEELDARVLEPLLAAFPHAQGRLDLGRLEGLGYYTGSCVRITARDASGMVLPLVDGGYTRWTQRLLGDKRERFLITGIGSDLVCARLRKS